MALCITVRRLILTSNSERERLANIARNREILAQLGIVDAASAIKSQAQTKAKPIQPRVKKSKEPPRPTRQSTRLRRGPVDPDESPQAKRKREVSTPPCMYNVAVVKINPLLARGRGKTTERRGRTSRSSRTGA